jgi:hypothetical protein
MNQALPHFCQRRACPVFPFNALTLPQVAATLAATLVAYHTVNLDGQRLLDERMLNAVLVLMLVTSILGPLLTERFAPRMLNAEARKADHAGEQ